MKQEKNQNVKQSAIPTSIDTNSKLHLLLALLACMALPLIIYSNSLNVPFILDDIAKIVENPDIKSSILKKLVYPYRKSEHNFRRNDPSRPVTYLSFALNYYWGNLNPFGYHLFNVFLHGFCTVLIFFLMRTIFLYAFNSKVIIFPLLIALSFAAHPVNTNVVTYIFSRSDALATIFYLSSLLLFIKTFETPKYLIFSLLCFILALFSKQTAITLPAVLLLFDFIFLSDCKLSEVTRKISYHFPFWILIAAYLCFRVLYFGGIGDLEAEGTIGRYSYFITQPSVILGYLRMLLIPTGFCIDHHIRPAASLFEFKALSSFLILGGIVLFVTYMVYRRKTDLSKVFLFSLFWFLLTLAPTSSFFPLTSVFVENRMYLAGIGFHLGIIAACASFFKIDLEEKFLWNSKRIFLILSLILVGVFSFLTWGRNRLYQNPILLWQEAVTRYPDNSRALYNLALLYSEQKEYEEALPLFQRVVELDPNDDKANNNLGMVYYQRKEFAKAVPLFQRAIKINPNSAPGYYNLGNLYYQQREYDKAFQSYRKVIELASDNGDVYNNLGNVSMQQKDYNKAEQFYKKAVELNPNSVQAHNNLGALYFERKEYSKVLQEYEILERLVPNNQDVQEKIRWIKKLAVRRK